MRNQNFIIVILLIFGSFNSQKNKSRAEKPHCFSMIWNDRITKRSWIYLNQDKGIVYRKNSDITDGDVLKMPQNNWDAMYTDAETKQKFNTPNKTNASFKFVTLGYKVDDQKKKIGFDFMVLNSDKKNNEPYIFRIVNNSQKTTENVDALKETGFVFDNWPQYWKEENKWSGGRHSFSDNYQIDELENINVSFKFRLVDYKSPLDKKKVQEKWLGCYATADLRFDEYSESGILINSYLIGVVFSNPLKVDFNGNKNDNVLFKSVQAENKRNLLLIHGNKNGIKEVNAVSSKDVFQTVQIDFKPLVKKYLNINKNHKNIITGLDIYSATRAADYTYEIKDVQIIGCKN